MKKNALLLSLLILSSAHAMNTNEIVFGQSAFLSEGALQLYGTLIKNAINARFNRMNAQGGIQGKKLRLHSMDDGGESHKTLQNIKTMKQQGIEIFLGNMGTRGVFKALPLIQNKEIAILFPWGGDEKIRKPTLTHLVNGLGLIKPQINALITYAIETLRYKKIALFHDDSSFGQANQKLANTFLKERGITPVSSASYNRFTMNIVKPAKELIETDPKIVISLATSMPTVKLINKFLEKGHYGTKFIGIDSTMFVGDIMKRKGVPFSYASPMPHPEKSQLPIVREFREDLEKYFPKDTVNVLSLAYYIHAAIVIEALKNISGEITKEKLLTQIESFSNYDLGGFIVDFNKNTRHAYQHNISILEG